MSRDHKRTKALESLAGKLGVRFGNLALFDEALTHSSYANESRGVSCNERLEFLGDSVVGLVVSDLLFSMFPTFSEGELARAKANVVSAAAMAEIGHRLGLGDLILLGRGEKRSKGRGRESIVADAVEAVIGAVYLDQSWEVTHDLITRLWQPLIESVSVQPEQAIDPKSALQEILQANGDEAPVYRLKEAYGPDHAKTFLSEVVHNGRVLGIGKGQSKKEAEQEAARKALGTL